MIGKDNKNRTDKARKILVQEYFTSALRVPEIEGFLHLKDGYKNKWKKIYVILRASGLYQTLKGKAKVREFTHWFMLLHVVFLKHTINIVLLLL